MGFQSEKGDRSSCHALFDSEQTSGNAKIQDLTSHEVKRLDFDYFEES